MKKNICIRALFALVAIGLPVLALAHGMSEADAQAMIDGGNLRYLLLGATHMLTGYDHLLFIFGVIFFLTGFHDIVKYITAFTLGHSLTLVFATICGIRVYPCEARPITTGLETHIGESNSPATAAPSRRARARLRRATRRVRPARPSLSSSTCPG